MTVHPDDPKRMTSLDGGMDTRSERKRLSPLLLGYSVALLILVAGVPAMAAVHQIPEDRARKAESAFERGRILQQQGKFDAAEESYRSSVALAEEYGGAYEPILIDYLSQLGNLYFQMARYDQAIDEFRRAQHIIHRHEGVYSTKQLAVVEAMTRTYVRAQQISKADRQQRLFYQIVAKHYPPDDGRLLPALDKLGTWMVKTGQLKDGIDVYEQMLQIGYSLGDHPSQAEALEMLALSEFLGARCCPERRLERELRLLSENPATDSEDEVRSLMKLGDMYIATDRSDDARKLYRQAHALLSVTDARAGRVQGSAPELLSLVKPRRLVAAIQSAMIGPRYRPKVMDTYYVSDPEPTVATRSQQPGVRVVGTPLPICARAAAELTDRNRADSVGAAVIDLDFTVNSRGYVTNIRVLGSNGSRGLSEYVVAVLRATRFRPQLIAGEARTARHVRLTEVIDDRGPAEFDATTLDPFRISAMAACGSWQVGASGNRPVTR